jgi:VanZ family protein
MAWLPATLYMALIWAVSSFEIPPGPFDTFDFSDKLIHFCEFGGLGFLVAHATLRTWPDRAPLRTLAVAVLVTSAWGVLDELHQAFVPGRSAEGLDVLADFAGAVAGAAARFAASRVAARAPRPAPETESIP